MTAHQFDKRITAARTDLADISLKNNIKADHYVKGSFGRIKTSIAPLLRAPDINAPRDSELFYGEAVMVFEQGDEWCWIQNQTDYYVGYIQRHHLIMQETKPTHRIHVLRTYIYTEPDIKSRPLQLLSLNSIIVGERTNKKFIHINNGGWVFADHTSTLDEHAADYVTVAEGFLGTPYLWAGRSSLGLDCSALVQLSLAITGLSVLRDSDMQEETIGKRVNSTLDNTALQRGDLIFWKGHVGIMQNEKDMVHANGTYMQVTSNPVHEFARLIRHSSSDQ